MAGNRTLPIRPGIEGAQPPVPRFGTIVFLGLEPGSNLEMAGVNRSEGCSGRK